MCTNFVEPLPYQPPIPHQTFADTVSLAQVRNVRPRPVEPNVENLPQIRNVRQRPAAADTNITIPLHAASTPIQRIRLQAQAMRDYDRHRLQAIRAPRIYLSLNAKFYHVFVALLMCFINMLY